MFLSMRKESLGCRGNYKCKGSGAASSPESLRVVRRRHGWSPVSHGPWGRGGLDSGQAQTLRATGRTLAPTMSEMGALGGFGTEERPLICVLTGPLGLGWVTGCGDPRGVHGSPREPTEQRGRHCSNPGERRRCLGPGQGERADSGPDLRAEPTEPALTWFCVLFPFLHHPSLCQKARVCSPVVYRVLGPHVSSQKADVAHLSHLCVPPAENGVGRLIGASEILQMMENRSRSPAHDRERSPLSDPCAFTPHSPLHPVPLREPFLFLCFSVTHQFLLTNQYTNTRSLQRLKHWAASTRDQCLFPSPEVTTATCFVCLPRPFCKKSHLYQHVFMWLRCVYFYIFKHVCLP